MASFADQMAAAAKANQAVVALEAAARGHIEQTFLAWARGEHNAMSVRWKLESVVRSAYRSAAAVGLANIAEQAGLPGWKPTSLPKGPLRSPYLDGLVADVQRNLREYKTSQRTPEDLTRAISRISHSAGVAAVRGQSDVLLRSAKELSEKKGYTVRKRWVADFVHHDPCELCAGLHGVEVGIGEQFPLDSRLKVYGDLKAPPRHPRCTCHAVILLVPPKKFIQVRSEVSPALGADVADISTRSADITGLLQVGV